MLIIAIGKTAIIGTTSKTIPMANVTNTTASAIKTVQRWSAKKKH